MYERVRCFALAVGIVVAGSLIWSVYYRTRSDGRDRDDALTIGVVWCVVATVISTSLLTVCFANPIHP